MGRWLRVAWALGAAGCAAPAPTPIAPQQTKAAPAEVVTFCAGTILEHDVHRCSWELEPEEQRHRPESLRLLFQKGELVRLDAVSGTGSPQGTSQVYEYRGGRVWSWTRENRNGVVEGRDVLGDEGRWVRWLDEQDRPRARGRTNISGVRRVLSARGRVEGFAWVDWLGKPAADGAVYETRLRPNAAGVVVERSFFGARGEPVADASGAHRVALVVDARGLERERRYFDASGRAALVDGAHLIRTRFDAFGVPLSRAYFDDQGRPSPSGEDGAVALRYERDERGNEVALVRLDEQARPKNGPNGWAVRKRRYDERDAVVETSFFDVDDKPVRELRSGAAALRELRSERGNVTTELLFDEQGAPTLGADGYHRIEIEYDQRDNPTSYVYSDPSGAVLRARRLYYDGDRLIREEHRDAAGKPLLTAQGYASYEVSYQDDGSEGLKRYFDVNGGEQVTCHGDVPAALQRELAERASSLRSCYERLLRYGSTEEGKLLVELSIDGRGQVLTAKLVEDEVEDGDLSKCVLETMRLPYLGKAAGDCATVRVPVTFRQTR